MTMSRRAALAALLLLGATPAEANEIPCSPVEAGTIRIDGLLGDWKGVDGVGVDDAAHVLRGKDEWSGAADLSFEVFCNHDDAHLYLAINVRDEYFIRTKKASAGDDHLQVLFAKKTLVVYPGNLRDVPSRVSWGRARRKARGVEMAEAMQEKGYSVELKIAFKEIGARARAASIAGAVWVLDSDSRARGKIQTVMGTAPAAKKGSFAFAQAKADLGAFLKDKGLRASQIRTRLAVDVVGDASPEQVLLVGKTIGIVGEGLPGGSYFYLDLAVKQPQDIYWLKAMDLNGDGKAELVARYAERAGNGRRELVAVFRFDDANRFVRSFAHEVFKGQGDRTIVNRFAFQPRKATKRRGKRGRPAAGGIDFIVDKPVARGFTAESYREAASADAFSILLPWGEEKKRHFRFEGEEISRVE
jgi:hypothetical protein